MIIIHKADQYQKMRNAGKLAANLLNELGRQAQTGVTTNFLNEYAINFIQKYNTKSACFGYRGHNKNIPFPGHICTSVNHVICHGIPGNYTLKDGDIISIDVTLIVDGFHGDTCATFAVGKITPQTQALIDATYDAMQTGINAAIYDNHIGDIGHAIEQLVKNKYQNKYSIVEDYCGHGTGERFHQEPEVQHIGSPKTGPLIQEGMFFTVEPMINAGKKHTRLLNDGWTVCTTDYSLSAQFEHTIGITANGPEIFTLP